MMFSCSMCNFSTTVYNRYVHHLIRRHRHDPNFIVNCCFENCMYSTKSWNAFKIHVSRYHATVSNDECDVPDFDASFEDGDAHGVDNISNADAQKLSFATFMLKMECDHKMSQRALNDLAQNTVDLLNDQLRIFQNDLQKTCQTQSVPVINSQVQVTGLTGSIPTSTVPTVTAPLDSSLQSKMNCFLTQYERKKFYLETCGLVSCQEVKLGEKLVRSKGRLIKRNLNGYIVPLKKTLETLLNMPEVWHFVQNPRKCNADLMTDICDGSYVQSNPLFQNKRNALQLILSTDDVEIVNPLGAHVKKHKICMFYMTIGNIPPQFRSKLSAIQLVGIAKNQHLRKPNALNKFLNDFVTTVQQLRDDGVEIMINNTLVTIHGDLVLCPCDTLAAQWLGGFKEGVSFALKGCRTCLTCSTDMKTIFDAKRFNVREIKQHVERCKSLESQTNPQSKKYWSKLWGINFKSPLLKIHDSLDLPIILVHDPMHILMEGLVPYELPLLLYHLMHELKLFSLDWLNSHISAYPYSYLDVGSKPEHISHDDIMGNSKLKQTSAAMLTLCYILPHILGNKIPENDAHWCNFLRLIQIVLLATLPYANVDTAGELDQLVMTHHNVFVELNPRANIIPKMHYCLHLSQQILLFGPLRSQWCMRFEAKHGFFKSFKWKCFKNIPKSLAEKHQLWMCSKMFSASCVKSNSYLYAGDLVADGREIVFDSVHSQLVPKLTKLLSSNNTSAIFPLTVYSSPERSESIVATTSTAAASSPGSSAGKDILPLPDFSAYVKACLRGNDSSKAWTKVIEEMAFFYLDVISNDQMTNQSQYLDIGRRMLQAYPCLKRDGSKPWSQLTKSLSQKIRTERMHRKRKSLPLADQPAAKMPKASFALANVSLDRTASALTEDEYRSHVAELKKAGEMKQPNVNHMRTLLRETYDSRRQWLKSLEGPAVKKILEEYPCFQLGQFVWEEFKLVLGYDDDRLAELGRKTEELLAKIIELMPRKPQGPLAVIDILRFVERETALNKGKGAKTTSVVEVLNDIPDSSVEQHLDSPAGQGPQLRVFTKDDHFDFATIVADGAQIETQSADILQALLLLLATYYIFDLSYPRPFSQLLGFLQQFVLGHLYTGLKSAKFSHFASRLK